MTSVIVVAGTRPEVIKLSPVLKQLDKLGIDYLFVWSGQHYDFEMSKVFFEELEVRNPDADLNARSGSHAEQTSRIMLGLEKLMEERRPVITVAQGDTNTVLATALTSIKLHIPFAHVEAGLRSRDMLMPEEINRKVADAVAALHFAPTKLSALNLIFEGISPRSIYVTGNTIVDVVREYSDKVDALAGDLLAELNLERASYFLVTLHRAENVDSSRRLGSILKALSELAKHYPVVFPMHPRTRSRIEEFSLASYLHEIRVLKPMGYFKFLSLLKNTRVVITDSGGVQEEALTLKIPTVTVRYSTERPETTIHDINVLVGVEADIIIEKTLSQAQRYDSIKKSSFTNPLGDGFAGERIARVLKKSLESGIRITEPDLRTKPVIKFRLLERWVDQSAGYDELGDVLVCFSEDGEPYIEVNALQRCQKALVRLAGRLDDKDTTYT